MSVGIIKERYEKLNTFLEKNLGALVLGILLGVLPITIYGIPFTLSLAENLLIGKHETYDLYSICKVLVAAFYRYSYYLFGLMMYLGIKKEWF